MPTKSSAQEQGFVARFWRWYERHYRLNLVLTTALFMLQLIHLYWLTTHVVAFGLLGKSLFSPPPFWQYLIIIVDYTEIPGLISTSLLYLYEFRRKRNPMYLWFLFLLNSQWIHLFWITDTFVINTFRGIGSGGIPPWLAWVAIFIDYLELPVIFDTTRRVFLEMRKGRVREALGEIGQE